MDRPFTTLFVGLAAVIILIIIIQNLMMSPVSYFYHVLPKERYPDVVNEFGKPDFIINDKGGMAIWKNKDFFEEIVLKDESIEHKKPAPHCDFLYSTVNVYIPDELIPKVLRLSRSVNYDNLKKELTARCHFMGANVATLYLAMQIVNDYESEESPKSKYGKTIASTMNKETYKELYDELGQMVRDNQNKYKDNMPNRECVTRV